MPAPIIRVKRSIFFVIRIPHLRILLLGLLLSCNRTAAPHTTEEQKAKAATGPAEPAASAARTAALIDMDRTPAGALLEQRLSKSTSLPWLERENLAALLKEQELQKLCQEWFQVEIQLQAVLFLRAGNSVVLRLTGKGITPDEGVLFVASLSRVFFNSGL